MASTNTETKMRTPTQMIQKKVYREDMTFEEEKAFVRLMYRKYEKAGFKPTYEMSAKLPENEMKYNGQPFKVVKRCEIPDNPTEEKKFNYYLCELPMWTIKFEDGHKLNAYPEEISTLDTSKMAAC